MPKATYPPPEVQPLPGKTEVTNRRNSHVFSGQATSSFRFRTRTGQKISAALVLFILLLFPVLSWSAKGKTDLNEHYALAKEYYQKISSDRNLSTDRKNWLESIGKFRRIYRTDQNHELSPSSLFMMARIYHDMYDKFKNPLDLGESIAYYEDIISLYSKNRLADDALYALGNIYLDDRKDLKKAGRFFKRLLTNYPDGDMAMAAAARYEKISVGSEQQEGDKIILTGTLKTRATGNSDLKNRPVGSKANLKPLRYWSTVKYTRVVIETTSPVQFKENLLEKIGDQPRRLYVDLQNCLIAPELQKSIPIDDGLLRRVRSGQYTADSVRVVLDTQSLSDYKIFSLEDPFRIVIDVNGQKEEKTPEADSDPMGIPTLAQQLGLGIKRIILDPGHGGKDSGARGFGLMEKDIVLDVARKVAARLRNTIGCEVILTRDMDVFIPLEERTAIANTKGGDLFISIHVNASPSKRVRGVETYILDLARSNDAMQVAARENATSTRQISDLQTILLDLIQNSKKTESIKLAELVQESMVSGLKKSYKSVRNLGVKEAPFVVLVGAQMPAILAEISFISNPTEAKLLKSEQYLNTISDQITAGVSQYVTDLNVSNLAYMQ
ncbi:MAG: N-acetylmuramoyl-L-alanine amidase [Proteobacteria bacterium]|nr:N-acetylmuramoyl-L-alanine amidase [Pseudomonadota bacterium]MBU1738817.1 N-acetylmuramoyl-L-alanine amidase [Pseudomonadota bacterium]